MLSNTLQILGLFPHTTKWSLGLENCIFLAPQEFLTHVLAGKPQS